jgi:two-component system KDP operon response regulator KdpE
MMGTNRVRILVVEDDLDIQRLLRTAFESQEFEVQDAANLSQALTRAASFHPDLIVLDLGLPDGDGLTFIDKFRAWSQTPILIVSARMHEADKVKALDRGADDFLSKPFGLGELLARVRVQLRRGSKTESGMASRLEFGDVVVDFQQRMVTKAGQAVHITPTEYRLLTALTRAPGKMLTQNTLMKEVWGPHLQNSSHYLRIYVGHLRRKLEDDPSQPRHFMTETGVGYRFVK